VTAVRYQSIATVGKDQSKNIYHSSSIRFSNGTYKRIRSVFMLRQHFRNRTGRQNGCCRSVVDIWNNGLPARLQGLATTGLQLLSGLKS
jgi:hypothetical protein